jgi:hypothetical protein
MCNPSNMYDLKLERPFHNCYFYLRFSSTIRVQSGMGIKNWPTAILDTSYCVIVTKPQPWKTISLNIFIGNREWLISIVVLHSGCLGFKSRRADTLFCPRIYMTLSSQYPGKCRDTTFPLHILYRLIGRSVGNLFYDAFLVGRLYRVILKWKAIF